MWAEYGVSMQVSDICKTKEKIDKFANNLETNKQVNWKLLKVVHDEQLDKVFLNLINFVLC